MAFIFFKRSHIRRSSVVILLELFKLGGFQPIGWLVEFWLKGPMSNVSVLSSQ